MPEDQEFDAEKFGESVVKFGKRLEFMAELLKNQDAIFELVTSGEGCVIESLDGKTLVVFPIDQA